MRRGPPPPLPIDAERAKGFKLPFEVYVMFAPMTVAFSAMLWTAYHWVATDPEHSTAEFYNRPEQEVVARAETYHHNPIQRFFDKRVHGHQSWGVFENDFGKARH